MSKPSNRPSYKEACQLIVDTKVLVRKDGTHPTDWRQVWEYSPRGELMDIPYWYELAKAARQAT